MLKIIALITCDNCNGVLPQIAAAEKIDEDLREELHQLQLRAEDDGWESRRNSTKHYCCTCRFS